MQPRKAKGQRKDLGVVITATWDHELHRTVAVRRQRHGSPPEDAITAD